MSTYLDWINVMTYDFHGEFHSFKTSYLQLFLHATGGWESKTGHNAPLFKNDAETTTDIAPSFIKSKYNCHAAIQGYLAAGVPVQKILMGLPLYGRGWQGLL